MAWSFPSHQSWSMTGLHPAALQGRPCTRVMLRPLSVPVSCSPFHTAASRRAAALGLAHDCEPGVSGFQFFLLTQRLFVPSASDIQGSFLNIFFKALLYFCIYGNKPRNAL